MHRAAKVVLAPLLLAQALRLRARLPRLPEAAGPRQGAIGEGPPRRLLVAGDSSAAGVGVALQEQALAQPLARELARRCGVRVEWGLVAESGLTTERTRDRLLREFDGTCDAAVIVTGVNDVIEQVSPRRAVRARDDLATWLFDRGRAQRVVFTPLPPVHEFPSLPDPLRWVAGLDARRHDAALTEWASSRPGVSVVGFGMGLRRDMMAADGFHPGAPVYRACVEGLAEHLAPVLTAPAME